jgi:phosphopantothenate---cysteine ligase (ATP)
MEDQHSRHVSAAEHVEEDYFQSNPPPKELAQTIELTQAFVKIHASAGRRVALVTSGGTTVPLENQTVRFIDNFSAGTRGATSAEYFLEHGYAVIFLHRKFSLLPYSRHYSHSTNCFLDFMARDEKGKVYVKEDYQQKMQDVLQKYQNARDKDLLLLLPFTTITEYLWSLKEIALALRPIGTNALFYLAAAVSDFFIPRDRLSEHKIQSSDPNGSGQQDIASKTGQGRKLVVDLDPVPKFLKRLVDGWAPDAMIVSFKLETDPSLLISKAKQALGRYSHHLVIGNLLVSRSWEVVLVSPGKEEWVRIPSHRRTKSTSASVGNIRKALLSTSPEQTQNNEIEEPMEIESIIIPKVLELHDKVVASSR